MFITVYFKDEIITVTDAVWRDTVSERFWNAPKAAMFFTEEQRHKLRDARICIPSSAS